jgi:hypothetical protein
MPAPNDADLLAAWQAAWPRAIAAWSPYVQLREPRFMADPGAVGEPSMNGQIAAIRMVDLTVLVNTSEVRKRGLAELAVPILAHEVGHHVHVPGSLTDHARLLAATRYALTGLPEGYAPMVANLYADLHVNDRLHRRAGIDMAAVYRALREPKGSRVWALYTRAYEHLWRLPKHSLAPDDISDDIDGDALLVARIVRAFAGDWMRGARRFASVLYPWLAEDAEDSKNGRGKVPTFTNRGLLDTPDAGQGAIPDGLADFDPSELDDDGFTDDFGAVEPTKMDPTQGGGQARSPWSYADLLRQLGVKVDATAITAKYYRERALPHLLPFPSRAAPRSTEPLAEGYDLWQAGDDIDDLDMMGSVLASPVPIPGVTTMRRVYGETPGDEPRRRPMDLDIYVDCSGSMPCPTSEMSWLALAGVILALSALRMGARVQATLWSGPGQTARTEGFVTDETAILGVVCGYISGGTSFPLPLLRQTWEDRKKDDNPAHIVVISDDGVDTLLLEDERGTPGADVAKMALERARGGGTLVLNLWSDDWKPRGTFEALGFRVHRVQKWEDLLQFARAFVREAYAER